MKQILSIVIACFALASTALAQTECTGTSCLPTQIKASCTVMESNGCIDWENGVIYATGMGVPNLKFETQAQRTYSAYEAAKTVAMRNLLQMVQGIQISSTRTVKAGMLEDDTINTQISGQIRQVQEAGKPQTMNDGSVWVTMKMYLRDIISILVNNQQFALIKDSNAMFQKAAPDSEQSAPKAEDSVPQDTAQENTIYTGVIIDARGTGITPAMSPKVLAPDGKEVYGSIAVEREFVLRYGVVGYVKDLDRAKSNERVKGNPLLIKATGSENNNSDLVISQEDAELLNKLDASQTFLREARVIVIIG